MMMKRHLNMENDTDSTTSQSSGSRLGKCEVCNLQDAKYTCPKCEVKTCCLNCLKIHKKELNCDGIRDRTKYIPMNKMTKMDFMNDYNFLEECTRYVEDRKRDYLKRYTHYNKSLPSKLFKLRNAAYERKIALKILLDNFTKHKVNTTFYDWKEKIIYWRIEWIFMNASNLKYVDERCSENDKIIKLLDKYLNIDNNTEDVPMKKSLEFYQAKGIGNIKILLKAEGVKKCRDRFYSLDCCKTLKENLAGKTIVEYPVIYLSYDEILDGLEIIDSDEDVETEAKQYRATLDEVHRKQLEEQEAEQMKAIEEHIKNENDIQAELEKLLIARKRDERRKKREELKNEPQNFLIPNERLLEVLSSSDSEEDDIEDFEDGNETEEEKTENSKYSRL